LNKSLFLDVVGSWLVPGFGYFRRRRYTRAIALFIVIELTVFLGFLHHGSVTLPLLDPSGGGVISCLTFLIQLGGGLVSILSLAAVAWSEALKIKGFMPNFLVIFFAGNQPHAYFELGAFYLMVAGAMNYFAVTNFYDRYKTRGSGTPESRESHRMDKV